MHNKGFTLIEVLLSLALMALLAVMSVPVYQSFQVRNDLDIAAVTLAQTLRRAELLSQAVDGDSTWGVRIESGLITLFKGASYGARDFNFDETFIVPTSITPSGAQEFVFAKLSGAPQSTGTVTFTSSINETRTITVNARGTVGY